MKLLNVGGRIRFGDGSWSPYGNWMSKEEFLSGTWSNVHGIGDAEQAFPGRR